MTMQERFAEIYLSIEHVIENSDIILFFHLFMLMSVPFVY